MVKKLIIFGIDGMDRDVVIRYKDDLPNLYSMIEANKSPRLRSVFPADTTPAWATIYTGKDPSEHGIINFVNVGAKNNTYRPLEFSDDIFRGRVFWDELNRRGLSCAVILPMNIKEGWDIDGLMITRPYRGNIRVYPKAKQPQYAPCVNVLGTESKFTSQNDLHNLRDEFFAKVHEEIRLTRMAIKQENVDVLFSYFSTTDGIQHDFWSFCDPTHPKYPGPNAYDTVIRDMYQIMDSFIGEVIAMQPDTPFLILSDHGHGARPVYTVRINELLRRGGYLVPRDSGSGTTSTAKKKIKKLLQNTALSFVKKVGLPPTAVTLAKRFPIWKNLFASGNDFRWDQTQAYLSDLSALKHYSYGGIRLNENVENKDALADEIIAFLKDIQIDGENKPLFSWIIRTNTFYHGLYLDRYPEIIYQMDERWGGEWELGSNVFVTDSVTNLMSSGGHRWRTAILTGRHINLSGQNYEMTDIYQIIMESVV